MRLSRLDSDRNSSAVDPAEKGEDAYPCRMRKVRSVVYEDPESYGCSSTPVGGKRKVKERAQRTKIKVRERET